jgi:membrane-bound ClpP family serine protease
VATVAGRAVAAEGLAFMLLFIGFITLSAEANAPGLSIPGFISMVCFALYFWIKFLAGTAEWLELILFAVGLICIGIEIFVLPGFGVFGIGGLAMAILGLVLMSQTFVIPKNTYQIEVLTQGLWIALGGAFGLIGGFFAVRMLFPHIPLFSGLVMDAGDTAAVEEAERVADYAHLLGQTGTTTTPLLPSGKARFGDEIVAVVSDGSAIGKGDTIRVTETHGNRVVVELVGN